MARGLRQTFPESSFTLSIPQLDLVPQELTYIGGQSGSGKSTLIKILAMEIASDAGDLWIMDLHLLSLSEVEQDDVRGGALTYIPQGHLGLTDHTPIQNIERVLHDYDDLSWEDARRQAVAALGMAGLPEDCFERQLKHLSGGEQARVAIAKVYARRRPICLADEILPALDDASRKDVVRLLQGLATSGFTVAIIAHQPDLKPYFHRTIEMRAGQIVVDTRQPPQAL